MGLAYIPVLCIYLMSKLRWKWKWHPGNLPKICSSAKSLLSCPTLCDPIDGSPPDSPVPGILQARTLEWVAISFSNAWKWKVKVKSLSPIFATPWAAAYQAPPSMGFSRQEYWSRLPLPSAHLSTASKSDQSFMIHLTKLGLPMWFFGKESAC